MVKINSQEKVRDSQKKKVYKWEQDNLPNFYSVELTLHECKLLVYKALWWWLHVPIGYVGALMPIIKDGRGTRKARGGIDKINLPPWARTYGVVLHETAHCIIDRMGKLQEDGGHGPHFMRMYIELLARFHNMDKSKLLQSAKADKIKVISIDRLKRPKKNEILFRMDEDAIKYGRVQTLAT